MGWVQLLIFLNTFISLKQFIRFATCHVGFVTNPINGFKNSINVI